MRFLIFLLSILFFLCSTAKTQTDSLAYILKNLHKETADEKLKNVLHEARILYEMNIINDSLSQKLLYVADLLSKKTTHRQQILSYHRALTDVLWRLSPKGEHIDYAYSLDYLAGSHQRVGDHLKALSLYLEALTIKEKALGEDHLDYATNLHIIADIYHNSRRYDKAVPLYQQELVIKRKKLGENNYDYVNCLISLCWAHNYLGHYDTALSLSQSVLVILNKMPTGNASAHAYSLMNIARLYHRMGQYDRSLALYQQSLAIKKQTFGEEHFDYAVALIDVGYFHHSIMGDYAKALLLYEEALQIIEKIVDKKDPENNSLSESLKLSYRLNLNHLATVNYLMRSYDKALPLYQKSLKLFPKFTDCMTNLANVYYSMGLQDSALFLCRQILTILKESEQNSLEYAYGANSLAVLFYNMGRFDDALPLFEEHSRITKEKCGKEHFDYANSLNSLGMVHTAFGNTMKAALLFDEAANITLNSLTRTYATLSEQEKIAILTRQSYQFDFLPSLLFIEGTSKSFLVTKLYENVLALKGMVLEDQKDLLNSIRKSGDSNVLEFYYQWCSNKAFVGAQQLLPLANRVPYFDSLENITNQLEQYLSSNSLTFRNQRKNKIITIKDVSQNLLKGQAAIEFIRFQLFNKKWTDSILYAALVLLPDDSIPRFVPLCEERQLQRLLQPYAGSTTAYTSIQRLYGSDKYSSGVNEKGLNDLLYRLIWKPLENHLKDVETIYYAPSGLLHRISFNALKQDANHFLIDKFQLNQVLNTRSVAVQAKELEKPLLAAVWGNIDYDLGYASSKFSSASLTRGLNEVNSTESVFNLYTNDVRGEKTGGWPLLPDSKKEIDAIKKTIAKSATAISVVSGGNATEEAFKAFDGKSPQVLHLATHGFFLPIKESKSKNIELGTGRNSFTVQQNPMFRSGLVLARGNHTWKGKAIPANCEDGILTAYEIAQIDLSNTELLVLSACETALGDLKHTNEGVIGLQRAFKLAGVKKMIMSLWQVPDKETVELFTLFYNNWLRGQTIRAALHNAQMKMKQRYSAYYWAAFVIVE
jgi:CHAT domain-containing protein/tetratricopeptide (TPR) repeat protein